jgi:pimeloyl-ACP methyl ester carboxylesterase
MSPGCSDRTPVTPNLSDGAQVAELSLSARVSCLGEYLRAGDDASVVVLLHDRGRDLDDLRPLAGSLNAGGFNVLSLDLPGHGLSSGDYEQNSREAILAASVFADPELDRGVAFIAEGQTCGHLLATEPARPIAMVLLRPQALDLVTLQSSVWRVTPALLIVDPDDPASERAADQIAAQARARTLRFCLHGGPSGDSDEAVAGESCSSTWTLQTTSMATRFLLEQWTHWKAGSPRQRV